MIKNHEALRMNIPISDLEPFPDQLLSGLSNGRAVPNINELTTIVRSPLGSKWKALVA